MQSRQCSPLEEGPGPYLRLCDTERMYSKCLINEQIDQLDLVYYPNKARLGPIRKKFQAQFQKKIYPDVKLHPGKFEGGPGKFCSRWTKFFLKMAKKLKLFPPPRGKPGKFIQVHPQIFQDVILRPDIFFFDAGFHFPGDDLEAADCSSIFPSLISYIVLWIDLFWCGQTGQRCGPSYRTCHISTQSSIFLISTFVFTHQYFLSHYRLFVFRCT